MSAGPLYACHRDPANWLLRVRENRFVKEDGTVAVSLTCCTRRLWEFVHGWWTSTEQVKGWSHIAMKETAAKLSKKRAKLGKKIMDLHSADIEEEFNEWDSVGGHVGGETRRVWRRRGRVDALPHRLAC